MVNRKTVSALTIAALIACAVPIKSKASALGSSLIDQAVLSQAVLGQAVLGQAVLGQAAPTFPVPASVEKGTEITVSSSSDNMNAISAALRQGFESTYANSKVTVETKDANAALQDVLNGNADLAAISRPLTAAEKQKGLIAVPVRREKIAIVVDKDNPFSNSITGSQFAQIFRGEIKNWSAVGGPDSVIKLVDRPASSETRQALSPYPVFTTAPFNAANGATTLESDTPEALITALGTNGVGYVLVGELAGQPELKALPLHQTPPSDSRYPFSQPYSFVYAGGASPAVSAFLGYATGNPGQAVVNDAGVSGVGLIPNATGGGATAAAGNASGTATGSASTSGDGSGSAEDSSNSETAGTSGSGSQSGGESATASGGEVDGATLAAAGVAAGPDGIFGTDDDVDIAGPDGVFGTADDIDIAGPDGIIGTDDDIEIGPTETGAEEEDIADEGALEDQGSWWWLLLPLAGLGLLIWAASRTTSEEETGYIANADLEDDRDRTTYDGNLSTDELAGGTPEITGESSSAYLKNVDSKASNSIGQDVGKGTTPGTGVGSGIDSGVGVGAVAAGGAAIAASRTIDRDHLTDPTTNSATDSAIDLATEGVSTEGTAGDSTRELRESGLPGREDRSVGRVKSDMDDAKSSIRGDVTGIRGETGSRIEGRQGNATSSGVAASGLDSSIESSNIDSTENELRANVDTSTTEGSSWLDRAKQRINEATEQAKDAAADLKDDMTDSR